MARDNSTRPTPASGAHLGFEAKLWLAADKLRNNRDAAEYKHVVLGLIFLKYISDTFEEHRAKLVAGQGDYAGANPEDKHDGKRRDRRQQTLFLDARKLGTLIDRVHRELTDADLARIVGTYHAWRGDKGAGKYQDTAGFCKSATTAEIAAHGHVLTPGRYVGAEEVEDDGEAFDEKMPRLVAELHAQFAESAKLEKAIKANLRGLGYGG
jgi:type I restriction-modification system DNA methylase subunit